MRRTAPVRLTKQAWNLPSLLFGIEPTTEPSPTTDRTSTTMSGPRYDRILTRDMTPPPALGLAGTGHGAQSGSGADRVGGADDRLGGTATGRARHLSARYRPRPAPHPTRT